MDKKNFFIRLLHSKVTVVCLFVLCLFAVSCSTQPRSSTQLEKWVQSSKKRVLCTTRMIEAIATPIAGNDIALIPLMSGDLDPHSYELVKGDQEKFQLADLIIANGLGLEHGASTQHAIHTHIRSLVLGDHFLNDHHDRLIRLDGQVDPHIWMDVSLWKESLFYIAEAFSEMIPEKKDIFFSRAKSYAKKLDDVDQQLFTKLQSLPQGKRYLVTSHDAFNYFTRRYLAEQSKSTDWKERFKAPEGLAPDGQLGMQDIARIFNHLQKYNIHVVFPEANVSEQTLKKIIDISHQKGHTVFFATTPLYADSMGSSDQFESYDQMMLYNAEVIFNYLNAQYEKNDASSN